MTEAPFLSVLLTGYRRKEYLLRAARSAADQTLPREAYEIVVEKAFADPEIDGELTRLGCRLVSDSSESIGAMMRAGFLACRGTVISILDDDDEFEREKLEVVDRAFRGRPGLGYFHNGLTVINEQGEALGTPVPGDRGYEMSRDPGFCSSSISVRKTALTPVLDLWPRVRKAEDTFLDYATRAQGLEREIDPRPLTRYRVHGENTSHVTNFAEAYLATAKILASLPPGRARRAALNSLLGRYLSSALRGRSSDRAGLLWALQHLSPSTVLRDARTDLREVLCGPLLAIHPTLGTGVYRALSRGQVDWLPTANV